VAVTMSSGAGQDGDQERERGDRRTVERVEDRRSPLKNLKNVNLDFDQGLDVVFNSAAHPAEKGCCG